MKHAHSHERAARWQPLWQATLIGATGAMLLVKVLSGTLPFYVHVRYTPLIAGSGVALLLLAALNGWYALRPGAHAHDHGPRRWLSPAVVALMLPILMGMLVPSRALGSAAIANRGFGANGNGLRTVQSVAGESALGLDPAQWTLLDWVNALLYEPDNPRLQGQPIEQIGFVWQRAGLEGAFVLSRFVVSCCSADSLAIGLPVVYQGEPLANDQWVRVRGTVGTITVDGATEAAIMAEEVVPIPQPAQPYLYP